MAGFKESITKGITTINMKTSNFMEESKYKTYITSLENEINTLKLNLGSTIYEKWKSGADYKEGIEEALNIIQSKYDAIEEQKRNIEKLHEEEKQILGNQQVQPVSKAQQVPPVQPVSGAQPVPPVSGTVFCSKCGAPNESNYKFCCKCGNPLNS